MNALKFARELAAFESHLQWAIWNSHDDYDRGLRPLAASYKLLIDELVDLDDPRIPEILGRAIGLFNERAAAARAAGEEGRKRRDAEYAEAERRHELAITVECPYCGAEPGQGCRTAGKSGAGHPKGIQDHRDRYRAATDPQWKEHRFASSRDQIDPNES